MRPAIEMKVLHQLKPFWQESRNEIFLGSSLRLIRNLQDFKFVSKLDKSSYLQLLKNISKVLKEEALLPKLEIYNAQELSGRDKELLFERFIFTVGLNQSWEGEAFAMTQSPTFLAILNLIEHLQLIFLEQGDCLENLLGQAIKLDAQLSRYLDFAYHNRFGFLTAQAQHCGTGLIASMILHIPALIYSHQFENLLPKYINEELEVVGLDSSQDYSAEIIIIQNRNTLGLSEEKIVSSIKNAAQKLYRAELICQKELKSQKDEVIIDKIARSFGLAKHSYKIETKEAMQALSLIKLGVHIGAIEGIETNELIKLLFNVQRAHLRLYHPSEETIDLELLRANTLHQALQKAHLNISAK
jgi:protein arginine kinase